MLLLPQNFNLKCMKKKILIITATHGNEKIGIEVAAKLKKKRLQKYFDFLIANPKALEQNKEFVDVNLNRVYPGKKDSHLYEERRAYINLRRASRYRYIIDMHEASQGKDDFIIVPREKLSTRFPISLIGLEKVLLWPDPKGPISQVLDNAIELEFGMKGRKRESVTRRAERILKNFIKSISLKNFRFAGASRKDVYYVYGKLTKDEFKRDIESLRDFQEIENNGEKFRPLLTGQYLKYGIVCYKMKLLGRYDP